MTLHIECRFNKNSLLQRYFLAILPAGKGLRVYQPDFCFYMKITERYDIVCQPKVQAHETVAAHNLVCVLRYIKMTFHQYQIEPPYIHRAAYSLI